MKLAAFESAHGRQRLWLAAAWVFGAVSFAKGMRFPGRWAGTQAMVDYSQGFAKRGLFGATLGRWLHFEQYTQYSLWSYVFLAALIGALVLFTYRSGVFGRLGYGEPVALFFSSYALTYLAHLVGYLDILLAILTVGLLLVRDARWRFVLGVPVCVVALLIHEMFFVVFLPVILFSFVVDAEQAMDGRGRRWLYGLAVALGLVSLGTTLRLALLRPLDGAQVRAMRAQIESRVDFDVRGDVFDVMTRSFRDNVWKMAWVWGHDLGWKFLFVIWLVFFGITVVLLLRTVVKMAAGMGLRRPVLVAALVASLAPALMYVMAWDEGRWDTLICVDAYLVLLLLARTAKGAIAVFGPRYRVAVVLSVAISMASGEGLMDRLSTNTFPFLGDLKDAVVLVRRDGWSAPDQ